MADPNKLTRDLQRRDAIRDLAQFQQSLRHGRSTLTNPAPTLQTVVDGLAQADPHAFLTLEKLRDEPFPRFLVAATAAGQPLSPYVLPELWTERGQTSQLKDDWLRLQVRVQLWLSQPSRPRRRPPASVTHFRPRRQDPASSPRRWSPVALGDAADGLAGWVGLPVFVADPFMSTGVRDVTMATAPSSLSELPLNEKALAFVRSLFILHNATATWAACLVAANYLNVHISRTVELDGLAISAFIDAVAPDLRRR